MRTLIALALALLTIDAARASDKRPDIVVIMADDMGYSDIGCYGSEIRTPRLDALASNGLRLTQFYNTARCCPTRASLMTGLYPHQAGVGHMVNNRGKPGYTGKLAPHATTIAEVLADNDYTTALFGKWHLMPFDYASNASAHRDGWPLQRGFDVFFGTLAGAGSFFHPHGLTDGNEPATPWPGFYYTDAISDRAASFIETAGDDPLFIYVAYTAPHWPLHANKHDIDAYDGVYDQGWTATRDQRLERMRALGVIDRNAALSKPDPAAKPWDTVEHKQWQARRMAAYAAQITSMDRGIGRVVDALERTGRLDNTLLIFLADNGGCAEGLSTNPKSHAHRSELIQQSLGDTPLRPGNAPDIMPGPPDTFASYGAAWANVSNTPFRRYKHWVHEGGIASPLIVHWPRAITQPAINHHPAHVIDIVPTCLDAAGVLHPGTYGDSAYLPTEGVPLTPLFANGALQPRTLYWEHEGNRAIRRDHWKLVAKGWKGDWELYDMRSDRSETNNLIDAHPMIAEQLAQDWDQWAHRALVLPRP